MRAFASAEEEQRTGWALPAGPRPSSRRRRSRRSGRSGSSPRAGCGTDGRFAFEIEHRVDHVLQHARAGDLAVLGHVADEDDRRAAGLGVADEAPAREPRTWVTVPGAIPRSRSTIVWIESMMTRSGVAAGGERRDDVLDVRLGGELDRRFAEPQPLGAQADLRRSPPRPRRRRRARPRARARRRPGSAASTCRCRDRRRRAAPSRARGRRR